MEKQDVPGKVHPLRRSNPHTHKGDAQSKRLLCRDQAREVVPVSGLVPGWKRGHFSDLSRLYGDNDGDYWPDSSGDSMSKTPYLDAMAELTGDALQLRRSGTESWYVNLSSTTVAKGTTPEDAAAWFFKRAGLVLASEAPVTECSTTSHHPSDHTFDGWSGRFRICRCGKMMLRAEWTTVPGIFGPLKVEDDNAPA